MTLLIWILEDGGNVNLRMYWMVIESDTILDITTEAWVTSSTSQPASEQPSAMNDLMTQCTLYNMPTRANELVGSVVQSQCSTSMETIRRRNTQQSPQTLTSATVAQFDQLKERINAYQESIRSTPPRRSPTQRFGRTQYDVVTRQCEIAMGSVYGQAFHFRCRTYLR